jgi:hypothetical protein
LKKLILLAAMLAMVLAAAVPALAQYGAGDAGGSEDAGVSRATYTAEGESGGGTSVAPAPAADNGGSEIALPEPDGRDAGCSENDGSVVAARDPNTGASEEAGSVTLAPSPGCSEIPVSAPDNGGS